MKLILFDIDGTLIYSGGAGLKAMDRALLEMIGISDGFQGMDFAGKTDLLIFRELFQKLKIPFDNGFLNRFIDLYLTHLPEAVSQSVGHLKPGVKELLSMLERKQGISLGLLTGNLEQGARMKLEPYGINPYFPIGAFGDDEEDRNQLLPFVVKRFCEREGFVVPYENCVIIGDTPRDVACAKVHGASCIGVATGPYTCEHLQEAGADLAVPDLTDVDFIVNWLVESGDKPLKQPYP